MPGTAGAVELSRRHQHPAELEARGQRFFHQADAFEQCQAAPTARFAPLEITHRPLQISGYATSPVPDDGLQTSRSRRP